MRRITAVLSLFVLPVFLSILFMPRAAACPVSPPVPLRGLYLNSELIVVGKIGTPGKWSVSSENSGPNNSYRINGRKIPVQVEEVIKGPSERVIQVGESRYQWLGSGEENEPQVRQPDFDEEAFVSNLSQNKERRLFFLGKNSENGSFTEIYNGRSFTLPQKDLDVYITRLRELANIYNAGAPADERILEWLVSMAEDPVTRFEGAYELSNALARSAYSDQDEDEKENADETGEAEEEDPQDADAAKPVINDDEEASVDKPENFATVGVESAEAKQVMDPLTYSPYQGYGDLAKKLTADQKERLVRAALNLRFNYDPVKRSDDEDDEGYLVILSQTDSVLLDAVCYLRDRRVAERLLAEIPTVARHNTSEAADLLEKVARYFDDEKLDSLVDKYSNLSWRDSDDLIEDEKLANDQPAENAAAADGGKAPADTADKSGGGSGGEELKAGEKIPLPQKTYGQRRAELFEQIYARCNELSGR